MLIASIYKWKLDLKKPHEVCIFYEMHVYFICFSFIDLMFFEIFLWLTFQFQTDVRPLVLKTVVFQHIWKKKKE